MTNEHRQEEELINLKLRCVDLVLGCPLDRRVPGCPFRKVRQEDSVATRVNWVKSMDLAKLTKMLASHEFCLSQPAKAQEPHP